MDPKMGPDKTGHDPKLKSLSPPLELSPSYYPRGDPITVKPPVPCRYFPEPVEAKPTGKHR